MDTAMQLKPDARNYQLRLLVVAIFAACALAIHSHSIIGGVCVALLILLFIASALNNLLPGSSFLRLTPDGMTVRSLYRDHRVNWSDIAEFFVTSIDGRQIVSWNYSPSYTGRKSFRAFSRNLTGVDAGLSNTYGYSATDLAQLLNQWRVQHGGARPN